jgi:hypothetical protein
MAFGKKKIEGGWSHRGAPEFDGSSISGGSPVHSNTPAQNSKAAKNQNKSNAVENCRRCKPDGTRCLKHAKIF